MKEESVRLTDGYPEGDTGIKSVNRVKKRKETKMKVQAESRAKHLVQTVIQTSFHERQVNHGHFYRLRMQKQLRELDHIACMNSAANYLIILNSRQR